MPSIYTLVFGRVDTAPLFFVGFSTVLDAVGEGVAQGFFACVSPFFGMGRSVFD